MAAVGRASPSPEDTIRPTPAPPDPQGGEGDSTPPKEPKPASSANGLRLRGAASREGGLKPEEPASPNFEGSYVVLEKPENPIEAQRISNNYLFGLKKWKSHITSRPLSSRSAIVQDLYDDDVKKYSSRAVTTLKVSNILYAVLFGWWLALLYCIFACIFFLTFIGREYGYFCWKMAFYFLWPFGKFVHQVHPVSLTMIANGSLSYTSANGSIREDTPLVAQQSVPTASQKTTFKQLLRRPSTYLWLLLGVPVFGTVHLLISFLSWLFVITIPVARLHTKYLTLMFKAPEQIVVGDSFIATGAEKHSEIIMYTHQSVNLYYYKYTFDGVNIILVNLLIFVILAIILGYSDPEGNIINPVTKCILGVLAIIPLTYYIGMAITSISAQSSFAIGAILNATFGSMVEIILFVIVLKKGLDTGKECFQELVKSSLAGTILVSILFIPGMCMIVGGIKYHSQSFNPRSASVSTALLFVSIAGVFAPSLFSKLYGNTQCQHCVRFNSTDLSNITSNDTEGFQCSECTTSIFGTNGDRSLYDKHILPLIYACALVLPLAYIIGLVFTLKTHSSHIYDAFEEQLKLDRVQTEGHGTPQWSRIKSTVILLLCAVFIALCADLITDNIQPLLEVSGVSEYFIGVTMLALVPELPEVVNGVQFSLQNNVNLGIEIGSSTAIQVCLVQVPLLVLINVIYPLNLFLIFSDIHMFAVIFSVIVINYVFQDGKSDYFQGFIMLLIYIVLVAMYYFTLTPEEARC